MELRSRHVRFFSQASNLSSLVTSFENLFTINSVIVGDVIGFTSFGLPFYLLIISAVTLLQLPVPAPQRTISRERRRLIKTHQPWFKSHRFPSESFKILPVLCYS